MIPPSMLTIVGTALPRYHLPAIPHLRQIILRRLDSHRRVGPDWPGWNVGGSNMGRG
jgi:hypothetical protein